MIERFCVKNYKGLTDIDIPLTPIHVLVGQNDSGKTSLLEAIYAYCRSPFIYPLDQAFLGRWQGRELVYHSAEKAEVDFRASLSGMGPGHRASLQYGFNVEFSARSHPHCRVNSEYCIINNERLDIKTINQTATQVAMRTQGGHPLHSTLELIADLIGISLFYRFDAKLMAIPAAYDENRKFRMEPDGFGLPTLLDDILGRDPAKFIELSNRFCDFFPEFQRLRLETEPGATSGYDPRSGMHSMARSTGKGIFFETRNGDTIRAQQASDGAILFLGFLSQLYLPEPPRLLLIEEPEKGVYPKRIGQIVELLRQLTDLPGVGTPPQIIMTTHSPFLLSSFRPEEVTMMSRRGDHAIARPLGDAPNIEARLGGGEFYLGELWYNYDEEELFQDAR
ncbi:MAG TPA: AAA family ATPase [Isosphaeraceae bacterium]|jgi:hypothetical protein|nr:AAA family ATPase [Isosphaeraceae bacterium]